MSPVSASIRRFFNGIFRSEIQRRTIRERRHSEESVLGRSISPTRDLDRCTTRLPENVKTPNNSSGDVFDSFTKNTSGEPNDTPSDCSTDGLLKETTDNASESSSDDSSSNYSSRPSSITSTASAPELTNTYDGDDLSDSNSPFPTRRSQDVPPPYSELFPFR